MLAESDDDGLILRRKDCRLWLSGSGWQVGHCGSLLPFGNRLGIDAVALGERSQALLTILYCSTDRLCRFGASV